MALYALGDIVPQIDPEAFVHPECTIIGNVVIGPGATIWPQAVLRGDQSRIVVGARTSVQDGAVLHCTRELETVVGADCTIGHLAHLEGCTVEDGSLVGTGSIVLHRAIVRTRRARRRGRGRAQRHGGAERRDGARRPGEAAARRGQARPGHATRRRSTSATGRATAPRCAASIDVPPSANRRRRRSHGDHNRRRFDQGVGLSATNTPRSGADHTCSARKPAARNHATRSAARSGLS